MGKIILATIAGAFLLICLAGYGECGPQPALIIESSVSQVNRPEHWVKEGLAAFYRGAFADAVSLWNEAVRLYEIQGKPDDQIDALVQLSFAYLATGHYAEALERLYAALERAEKTDNKIQTASVLNHLGALCNITIQNEKAREYLERGLEINRVTDNAGLEASLLNNMGNLLSSEGKYEEAIRSYEQSAKLAQKTADDELKGSAFTNAARTLFQSGQYGESKTMLDKALDTIQKTENSHNKAYGLTTIGLVYDELRPHLSQSENQLILLAHKAFSQAGNISDTIGDLRSASYAWGYLGRLYEEGHRYAEALQVTERAVFAAQQVSAPESLYKWQWQAGRLFRAQGKIDQAIASYRHAVDTLQTIRSEVAGGYNSSRLSFRKSLGSAYLELVDLLLQQASSADDERYEPILLETREVVEMLKAAELRDYFQDDCVDAARSSITRLDLVSKTAVVIYTIILPDRTELLVNMPKGLKKITVQVNEKTLTEEVRKFRLKLEKRTTREYLPHAQKLYEWLIRPLEKDLKSLTVDTLVFVPDGPLRTIPMAALHDGHEFLIGRYAVAVTPGLNLTDPHPIEREKIESLAVGLTQSVQDFPPMPYVDDELQAIKSMYGGNVLLNQDFLISNMEKSLLNENLNVVHIASHGKFEGNVEKTYILTYDDRLTLDRLDQYVGLFQFRKEPLELLMLSACETAAGDDRAALGLAGVAVKAGARSAIATLWFINDKASSLLVDEFYRQLRDPSLSRARALQHAQLKLIHDPRYDHPSYWSPFLLINNWL